MSSLYPETNQKISIISLALASILVAPSALGAEFHAQPQLDLSAVAHDNLSMSRNPAEQSNEYGSILDLGVLLNWRTPTGNTSLRPRVRVQEYSTDEDVTNFEAFLDLRSELTTERSKFLLVGRFDRRDSTLAEFAEADFDDLDPEDPTSPESGIQVFDQTRERYEFRPDYSYRLSERLSLTLSGSYQSISYSDDIPDRRVGYDYLLGQAGLSWAMTPQTSLQLFGGASHYESDDGRNDTDSLRAGVTLSHRWSEQAGIEARAVFQRDEVTLALPTAEFEEDNASADLTLFRRGEKDEWRVVVGSAFSPSASGSLNRNTQFRVSYRRNISERTRLSAAARHVDYSSVGGVIADGDRSYSTVDLELQRFLTPTWYVGIGYTYRTQDRDSQGGSADDNKFLVKVGYLGLQR